MKLRKGFTLIEILASIAILSALTVIALTSVEGVVDDARFTQTVREMEQIRNALIGETQRLETGLRKNYGYLGDVGALPTTGEGLAVLSSMPGALNSWAIQNTYGIGMGWRGPYLANTFDTNYFKDGWGNDYVYTNTGTDATIVSAGANGVIDAADTGFNQDIRLNIPVAVTQGKLLGYVVQGSGDLLGADQIPFDGDAEVYLYYPDGVGGISSQMAVLAPTDPENGKYSFTSVPLGYGALKVFIPNSATATASNTLGPAIVEINKSATAAVPVTQDSTDVFGTTPACTAAQNFTVSAGSYSKDNTARTVEFVINYPSDYPWSGPFAYDQEANVQMSGFAITNTSTAAITEYRYSTGTTDIRTAGASNISTTGSNSFTIGDTYTFSSNTNYNLKFTYSATNWSNGHTTYFYRIGCKYVRAHPGM